LTPTPTAKETPTSHLPRNALHPETVRKARLATTLAGLGISDAEIAATLRLKTSDVPILLFQYQAHVSGYGAHPLPMFWSFYATLSDQYPVAMPKLQCDVGSSAQSS